MSDDAKTKWKTFTISGSPSDYLEYRKALTLGENTSAEDMHKGDSN